MDGAILIDKPDGITSAEVLRRLKRTFDLKKLGHAGTLDPIATGLLVVLVGKATRLQDLMLGGSKVYKGLIRLGLDTDTNDITGDVVENKESEISRLVVDRQECINRLEEYFRGAIEQIPPAYSAIKVDGKRSYQRARSGEAVELSSRRVFIHDSRFSFADGKRISYELHCSKGTYIRSIARDAGNLLGVGACLESIRRTAAYPFRVEQAWPLCQLEQGMCTLSDAIMPLEALVQHLPFVKINSDEAKRIRCGDQSSLSLLSDRVEGSEVDSSTTALVHEAGQLVAIANREQNATASSLKLQMVIPE